MFILTSHSFFENLFVGFRDSFLSYYNLDVLFNTTNVSSFYISFSVLLFCFVFYLLQHGFYFRCLYRRYCRVSYFLLRRLYQSDSITFVLHTCMLYILKFYFFLYGRGNSISLVLPEVRPYSSDFSFVNLYFNRVFLFSVDRSLLLFVFHRMEDFLLRVRPSEDSDCIMGFGRPFLDNLVDKVCSNHAILSLVSDFSTYSSKPKFILDNTYDYDMRLISFFDFSYYFKGLSDFKLFLHCLDFLYFDYCTSFGKEMDCDDSFNLFRKLIIPFYYGNFFRYVLWCNFHYFSFYSLDFFFCFIFLFLGFVCHYLFFPLGFFVFVLFFFYDFRWHLFFIFALPFFFGFFGFVGSFLFIFIFLMSRIITPFFYSSFDLKYA